MLIRVGIHPLESAYEVDNLTEPDLSHKILCAISLPLLVGFTAKKVARF